VPHAGGERLANQLRRHSLVTAHQGDLLQAASAANGRKLDTGEGLGLLRDVVVADTDEEALQLWQQGGAFCGAAWFAPFGFWRGFADPATGEMLPVEEQLNRGLVLVGSPDTVTRQVETILHGTPLRWLFAWTYNGLIPHDKIMRSLELFKTKVLPRVSNGA
jgi:alkanesulfonate monooxygenase SsuD/methylene tetrahydromethanopterin reductase-like flavin-dependent oxidoreductase (luciferase family)